MAFPELSYELPRTQWGREDNIFMGGENIQKGRFPGPWDEWAPQQKEKAAVN